MKKSFALASLLLIASSPAYSALQRDLMCFSISGCSGMGGIEDGGFGGGFGGFSAGGSGSGSGSGSGASSGTTTSSGVQVNGGEHLGAAALEQIGSIVKQMTSVQASGSLEVSVKTPAGLEVNVKVNFTVGKATVSR